MADIAFLMLIYWLVTTTMDQDKGLARRLPPMPDPNQQQADVRVNRRNIMEVRLNSSDRLFAGGSLIDINLLKDRVKEFIANPTDDVSKPEKEMQEVAGFGAYPISKAVISLQNDRSTSYEAYIKVQGELVKAYDELRDEFAMAQYGNKYTLLSEDQKEIVRKIYPQNISEAEPRDVTKK